MSLRLGLIGCGEHSEVGHAIPLARYAAAHPNAITLATACDLHRQRAELFCKKYSFARAYENADEMLAKEQIDICIAVVPVECISGIGIKLLQAKMPCVVEKPLGATIVEVQKLLEVATSTQTTNMVSVNRRFMPFLNRGMEWAQDMGKLHYVYCAMLRHARTEPEFLCQTAIHAVDTMRFIGGEIETSKIRTLTPAPPHSYAIEVQFESGVQGRIDVLPTAGVAEERYELTGDDFRAVVTSPFGPQRSLRCYREDRLVLEEIAGNETPEDVIQGFYGEASELIEALSNGKPLKPSMTDVFPSVELCFQLADRAEKNASIHPVPTGR
jgi:predicted dehydrogenase